MFGLDEHLAALADGGGLLLVLVVALLLGLRHATDPDHLTAISALMLSDARVAGRRATILGLSWGLGHATTLVLLGLPIVGFGHHLPSAVQVVAEVAVGMIIIALSARLLVRWRRGYLHAHPHAHGPVTHAHPHVHEDPHGAERRRGHPDLRSHAFAHEHRHAEALGRSPRAAYAIGLVHGAGGSAGVGVLLVGALADQTHAVAALLILAAGTALAMTAVSSAFGHAISGRAANRMESLTPSLGVASLSFGVWYTLGVVGALPYPA